MPVRPSLRACAAVVLAALTLGLMMFAAPASAAKRSPSTTSTTRVTVSLVCPPGNYERVKNIGLFDSRGNVVGAVGNLECGAGELSTFPVPAMYRQSVTVDVTKLPSQIGYGDEWRCADASRPEGSVINEKGPVYIAFGPTFVALNRKSPTSIPCQAVDSSGRGYASSMLVSW